GQLPQQLSQPLQQLSQPLQQLTSMFSQGGQAGSGGRGASGSPTPFSAFSNYPLAGGSGAGGGAGMVRAASLPGSGGTTPQTPLMSKLVGTQAAAAAVGEGAVAGTAVGGVAPMSSGAGM